MTPTVLQFRVTTIVLVTVGLVATVLRLSMRYNNRSLWWDDIWAASSGILAILLVAANMVHTSDSIERLSESAKVACYYMCIQLYYAVVWSSRLSILYTIVRLCSGRLRSFLIISSFLFLTFWAILFAQIFWTCETGDTSWKHRRPAPQCTLGTSFAVAQTITVVISDSILVFSPVKVVWGSKLSRVVKIRLIAVFASTIATTITSLVYIDALLTKPGMIEEYTGTIHAGVSLLVANLTVIVGFIFRFVSGSVDSPGIVAHDNTSPLHHDLRLPSSKSTATTLDPSVDAACVEVHVECDTVVHISIASKGHNVTKTLDLKSCTGSIDVDEADIRSPTHDLVCPDEKV